MSLKNMSVRGAIGAAIEAEMAGDDAVVLFGEDVARPGGVFQVTKGLFEKFGPDRVLDTPIAEQAIVGCAIGAAVTGLRPVVEIMFADFAGVAYDQIANQLAKFRFQTGGQTTVPVTIRLMNGSGGNFAAQHSQSAENWFLNHPGLMICVPASANDAYGLMRAAIRDDNPVLFFEHKALYNEVGTVHTEASVPLGRARVVREGSSVTLVATQWMVQRCERAAELLALEGVEPEILDLRTIVPLDIDSITRSVAKTGRLICVQECPAPGSWGSWILAIASEHNFHSLVAPPILLSASATPIPFAESLESAWSPSVHSIVEAARTVIKYETAGERRSPRVDHSVV